MTYRTLMVHVDLHNRNEAALRVTCDLAGRFKAKVIGITSGYPSVPIHAEGMIATSILEGDYEHFKQSIADCESRFRSALGSLDSALEWRSDAAIPADFLAAEARAADLLIVGRPEQGLAQLPSQSLDIGDAIMQAGRPTLVVPPLKTPLALNRALIAWKDTAETRRTVAAALPLLKRARDVMVVEIVPDQADKDRSAQRLTDVVKWLGRHDIAASANAALSAGHAGSHLDLIAEQNGADLIVAGAYGHSRLREWVFGGVTQYLLERASVCALMLH
jgi:nucleotide-binding universal stress UspA family protein